MKNRSDKTVSCKLNEELVHRFEDLLAENGHTKTEVFKNIIMQYIHYYEGDTYFKNMVRDMQFKNIAKVKK